MAESAGAAFVTLELARMRAAGLKQKNQADVDLDAMLMVFAEELARYSPEVVKAACRDWARANIWWPSLAELRQSCEELAVRERPRLPAPDYRGRSERDHARKMAARFEPDSPLGRFWSAKAAA